MRFDEEYPDAEMGCEKLGGYVKLSEKPRPCFMCGFPTQWVDLGYEAPLCSPECDKVAREDAAVRTLEPALTIKTHDVEVDTMTFHCATCNCERDLDDLPRATLSVCVGLTATTFTQLMCWPCIKILVRMLHEEFCPQDCEEEHEVR